jgi:hypothetical protein
MYAGGLGLLLRFARANHRSPESSSSRVMRQLLGLGSFVALVVVVSFGMARMFVSEAEAYVRAHPTRGYLTVTVVDATNVPVADYTVVVFPEDRNPRSGRIQLPFRIDSDESPELKRMRLAFDPGLGRRMMLPGRYRVVALKKMEKRAGNLVDPALAARLKTELVPFTIAAGETKTLKLTIVSD